MYSGIALLFKLFFRIFGKAEVINKEVLPKRGPFVIACTHTGWVDVLCLGATLYPLKINYMAKKQLFDHKFTSWLMKKLNAFPVDRENPGPSVLKIPARLLSNGEIVGIFPSGTRATEQTALKQGVITIAQRAGVPIFPVTYIGPNNLRELISRKKTHLIFGEPIHINTNEKKERKYYLEILEQKLISVSK
ncbi:1-acyl-sn-glycerol-3-phosphate acyltransferase [Bacillus sp. BRMEA1]|uniref:lysophospholipid acyltransferase family protein n=1 Tax=Neobacillus endophyticus TaxID=2738405 RepID=UPI0015671474|nr:1-acyl-sn-glycerol-3-phosphate acyltransferase [Neobacillus endophyticus]NRD76471.1 1-acyl-sn-glycerol-3-phosphate acyltransferase [Neobacillus endophyticus]